MKITTIDEEIILLIVQKNKPQMKDYIEFIESEIEKNQKYIQSNILFIIRHLKKILKKTS